MGGIIVFVRDDIPCKKLDVRIPEDIKALFLEINLSYTKWLFCGFYHPRSQNDAYFYQSLSNYLDLISKKSTNFFLAGDFNSEETNCIIRISKFPWCEKHVKRKKLASKAWTILHVSIYWSQINKSASNLLQLYIDTGLSDFHGSTQSFILLRLIKWVPWISGDLVVKSKLPPWSGSSLEVVEPHP